VKTFDRCFDIAGHLGARRRWLRAAALGVLMAAPVARGEAAERSFEVTASRFEYQPSLIEVDEGDHVVLHVRSTDTKHGLSIKEYKIKTPIAKTGEVVTVEFDATKTGTFVFACSEYCGSGHSRMKGKLVVNPKTGKEAKP
jgi:cytochrome c oxidase subunit 2